MHRFQRQDRWLLLAAIVLAVIWAASRLLPAEPPILGRATVVDGDTLRLAGERIRIIGIDAPELDQPCTQASGAQWRCGEAARAKLISLVRGSDTICRPQGQDRYGRVLASCANGAADLGEAMVRAGLAIADGDYFQSEAGARHDKLGIWSGTFVAPSQWRRQHDPERGDGFNGPWAAIRTWFR